MAKARVLVGLVGSCLLLGIQGNLLFAAPTVAQMLQFRPRQLGVEISTPSADERDSCKVQLVTDGRPGASGWLLVDDNKRPLRRFFDSDADKKIDTWSYYNKGIETYREIDADSDGRAEHFRWLNNGGMRWGIDENGDGRIDKWKMISSEEVAMEIFHAAQNRDVERLKALLISESELRSLELPEKKINKIRKLQNEIGTTFKETLSELPNLDKDAEFIRVETAMPHCLPADAVGIKFDLIQFPSRAILFEGGDKKHDWLQTGEMIRVGNAWRIIGAPTHEGAPVAHTTTPEATVGRTDPKLQKLLDEVSKLDANPPQAPMTSGPHPEIVRYNLERVAILQRIVPLVKGAERESWYKQIMDNLSTAAQSSNPSDNKALDRLVQMRDHIKKSKPESNLAAYATFRVLWANFAPKLADPGKDYEKVQDEWNAALTGFVKQYPNADDTPDALLHLAMGAEFAAKPKEALRWYAQLTSDFPDHFHAPKARGAQRRLGLPGNELVLEGPLLSDGSKFDVQQLRGKVVVVYYWASYCQSCVEDFERLQELRKKYADKGLEFVLVNLDDDKATAMQALREYPMTGIHLQQPSSDASGGLNSPLATYYGILSLPNIFLVGKDGKVISRSLQTTDLENAIKDALEK